MPILDMCGGEIVTVRPHATIAEAARKMAIAAVGCVIVTEDDMDESRPIGILTDRDIVTKVIARNLSPAATMVSSAMSKKLVSVPSDIGIAEAISLMKKKSVRRLLVENSDDLSLCGVVSIDDLLLMLGKEINNIGELCVGQIYSEERQAFSGPPPL